MGRPSYTLAKTRSRAITRHLTREQKTGVPTQTNTHAKQFRNTNKRTARVARQKPRRSTVRAHAVAAALAHRLSALSKLWRGGGFYPIFFCALIEPGVNRLPRGGAASPGTALPFTLFMAARGARNNEILFLIIHVKRDTRQVARSPLGPICHHPCGRAPNPEATQSPLKERSTKRTAHQLTHTTAH